MVDDGRVSSPPRLSSLGRLTLLLCCLLLWIPPGRSQNSTESPTESPTPKPTPEPTPKPSVSSLPSFECFDPKNPITLGVVRGGITTVCLFVGPDGDWNSNIEYKRFGVNLEADEFSEYEVPGSFAALTRDERPFNEGNSTHVFASSQSSVTFLRRYYDETTKRIFPYLTTVIDVRDGAVRGMAWDDACTFCEKNECVPNTYNFDGDLATTDQIRQPADGCSYTVKECAQFLADDNNVCDLKLKVVWTGTDLGGRALLSSDSRPSAFPPNRIQENVKNRYNSMLEKVNEIKEKFPGL